MMIDHRAWIGESYWSQSATERLLIAGFSHHGPFSETEDDHPDFTILTVEELGVGAAHPFFNKIADYFGEAPARFWGRVAFFNTLPSTVGDERYAYGTTEQVAAVGPRVLRIIGETRPARLFVFTRKGWRDMWPDYTGRLRDGMVQVPHVDEIDCGSYAHPDGEALAFGLRHPQFARTADMQTLVAAALAYTLN